MVLPIAGDRTNDRWHLIERLTGRVTWILTKIPQRQLVRVSNTRTPSRHAGTSNSLVRTPAAASTQRLTTALTTKGTHSGRRSDTSARKCGKTCCNGREASDPRGGSLLS